MNGKQTVLVTGGAGYIGSHVCVELLQSGYDVVVVDNLSNSTLTALSRVEQITGLPPKFYQVDIRDGDRLQQIMAQTAPVGVIHLAGLKAVFESKQQPLEYYENNVAGSLALSRAMLACGVRTLIFSSSASVYGDSAVMPVNESSETSATNPYGQSKLIVETMFRDLCRAPESPWKITLLRYFNVIGAHQSGLIGEDPRGTPNNLLPYVSQVAAGRLRELSVFGDDYPTPDGTGIRDYIHVVDLAKAHIAALENQLTQAPGCRVFNVGTGQGYSVIQIVRAFERVSGRRIPFKVVERRLGDVAESYADISQAQDTLGWHAELGLEAMIEDLWRWQSNNPGGYDEPDSPNASP